MSSSSNEIETRALFQDLSQAIKGLNNAGFSKTDSYLQHDIIIDKPDGSLFKSGQKIRIRVEKGKAELTFKGKFEGDDTVGRRKEINISFPVEETDNYIDLLNGLGYNILFQLKKERVLFSNNDKSTFAVIDDYPVIGFLLELEGPENEIMQLANQFFPDKTFKNYRLKELYQSHVEETGITLNELLTSFQNGPNGYDLGEIHLILE